MISCGREIPSPVGGSLGGRGRPASQRRPTWGSSALVSDRRRKLNGNDAGRRCRVAVRHEVPSDLQISDRSLPTTGWREIAETVAVVAGAIAAFAGLFILLGGEDQYLGLSGTFRGESAISRRRGPSGCWRADSCCCSASPCRWSSVDAAPDEQQARLYDEARGELEGVLTRFPTRLLVRLTHHVRTRRGSRGRSPSRPRCRRSRAPCST